MRRSGAGGHCMAEPWARPTWGGFFFFFFFFYLGRAPIAPARAIQCARHISHTMGFVRRTRAQGTPSRRPQGTPAIGAHKRGAQQRRTGAHGWRAGPGGHQPGRCRLPGRKRAVRARIGFGGTYPPAARNARHGPFVSVWLTLGQRKTPGVGPGFGGCAWAGQSLLRPAALR
jgi:hypothetical protein